MKILILYATTEGQTRKIARFVLDRLAELGHAVEMLPAAEADDLDPAAEDAVIVAGSVHAGQYQRALRDWVAGAARALDRRPTLFLSVSLAAAGDDPEDREGIRGVADRFVKETGWTPDRIEHVAGAFRFSEYDFFKSWAMRYIASQKDQSVRGGEDKEYTDWEALGRLVEDWTAGLPAGR